MLNLLVAAALLTLPGDSVKSTGQLRGRVVDGSLDRPLPAALVRLSGVSVLGTYRLERRFAGRAHRIVEGFPRGLLGPLVVHGPSAADGVDLRRINEQKRRLLEQRVDAM